jgi:hypothetical protein
MLNVSAWTDLRAVVKVFEGSTPLEVALSAAKDVYDSSEDAMKEKIIEIMKLSDDAPLTIRVSGSDTTMKPIEQDLRKLQEWCRIAKSITKAPASKT